MKTTVSFSAVIITAAATYFACGQASAVPLMGPGGPHLPLPTSTALAPTGVVPIIVPGQGSFTGTWGVPPVAAPWVGTFTGTGQYPDSSGTGISTWTFNGLAAGHLPAGTSFELSDVDAGSVPSEIITFTAFAPNGLQIRGEWLSQTVATNRSPVLADQLPGWSFANGVYTFDGSTVPGNPTILVELETLSDIGTLIVDKPNTNYGFGLDAPVFVPEPSSLALLSFAGFAFAAWRRRRTG